MKLAGKLFFLFCALTVFGRCNCFVFLQGTTTVKLPYDFPVGATFYRLMVLDEKTGERIDGNLLFQILRSVAFPTRSKSGRGLFTIDEHTGSIMLSPHRRHSLSEYKKSTFALDIVAISSARPLENTTHATVVINVTEDNFSQPKCYPREEICFSSTEIQLQVPEGIKPGTSLGSIRPATFLKLCPNVETQYALPSDALLHMSTERGYLKANGSFDYESKSYYEWNVSCEVTVGNESATYNAVLQVYVLDINDNAPYIQDSTNHVQEFEVSQIVPGKPLPAQLTVLDKDSAAVNHISVNISDPLGLFYMREPVVFHGVNGTYMLVNTALVPKSPFHFPDSSYNISVIFEDVSLIPSTENKEVAFHILIFNRSNVMLSDVPVSRDFQVVANIFRHSSHHARIVQPMEVKPHEGYFFRLSGEPEVGLPGPRIFGVTPNTGIVYIRDEVALARSSVDVFKLQLSWRSREETDRRCVIILRVLDAGDPRNVCGVEPGHHFPTCALHATSEKCTSSCGRGAADGFCRWRSQLTVPELTTHYATCSPHLNTCPDGTCDELEMLDPLLCPQDCAANINGEAVQGPSGRGISMSAAPCTCTGANTCVCVRFYPIPQRRQKPPSRNRIRGPDEPNAVPAAPLEFQDEWSECGTGCAAMIAVVSLVITGLIASAGFLICKRRGALSKNQEFPTVTTPLNPSIMPVGTALQSCRGNSTEDRLEFPRNRLSLEETIGEGEFGRVVKGKAKNIAGIPGKTTVAVKMLKEGSSPVEKRDLISELNLLKEISHPNVVRLLGACTEEDGPLYVIMEYAEHGSLITFLRKMRARYPEVRGEIRELISFAWQIAKGMEHLAEMKVVHRDLAARNILVAAGKVMKISDFGLSRDVYEGDTYLKTTKGRVPVKWMALESLQNRVYTTKSDVWSFGVVLWEIVTLGGVPYPGIPAENLYHLLKGGYRMSRPDDCPIQLYHIMTTCWRDKPQDRPHFRDLVKKLETLLNDSTHYLPPRDDRRPSFKRQRSREEGSVMQQLTFPRMSVVEYGPYENRRLLSPTEFVV